MNEVCKTRIHIYIFCVHFLLEKSNIQNLCKVSVFFRKGKI